MNIGFRIAALSRRSAVRLCLLLAVPPLVGCGMLRREPLPPSNSMRSTTSDALPTGMDNRARQIESNLGVR